MTTKKQTEPWEPTPGEEAQALMVVQIEGGKAKHTMKKSKVSLKIEKGKVEVDALVSGEFAVHRTLELHGVSPKSDWVVTHVRTGFAAPYSFPRRKDAVLFMGELALLDIDWSLPFRRLNTKAVGKKVAEAVTKVRAAISKPEG